MLIQDNKMRVGMSTPAVSLSKNADVSESDTNFIDSINNRLNIDNGFDNFAPHAPQNVKQAWSKASNQTGINGLGIGNNGMMTHIPAALIMQVEQRQQNGTGDVFGNSVTSASQAAHNILDRLENPITPETNSKIRSYHEQEITFYRSFIKNLEETGDVSAFDRWNYRL